MLHQRMDLAHRIHKTADVKDVLKLGYLSDCSTESLLEMNVEIGVGGNRPVNGVIAATLFRCDDGALFNALWNNGMR